MLQPVISQKDPTTARDSRARWRRRKYPLVPQAYKNRCIDSGSQVNSALWLEIIGLGSARLVLSLWYFHTFSTQAVLTYVIALALKISAHLKRIAMIFTDIHVQQVSCILCNSAASATKVVHLSSDIIIISYFLGECGGSALTFLLMPPRDWRLTEMSWPLLYGLILSVAPIFESRLQALMVPKRFPEHHYRPKNEHLNKWTNSALTRGEAKTWQT